MPLGHSNPALEPNPAQQRTLAAMRLAPGERNTFANDLADDLHSELNEALADSAAALRAADENLWVAKRALSAVTGCEASFLASQQTPFEYNRPIARGSVLHRSVEFWANPVSETDEAADYVGHAINFHIEEDQRSGDQLGQFLAGMSAGESSALASECTSLLQNFMDTFPSVKRGWKLGIEVQRKHLLCEGAIVLTGRFDLTLGAPGGANESGQVTPGRVVIDLKTGNRTPADAQDMRFYALLETLQLGVPPMLVGTFYVNEGTVVTEKVDSAVLKSAFHRTVDGTRRLTDLRLSQGDEPVRRPGPPCNWCPISQDCEPGQAWLNERAD